MFNCYLDILSNGVQDIFSVNVTDGLQVRSTLRTRFQLRMASWTEQVTVWALEHLSFLQDGQANGALDFQLLSQDIILFYVVSHALSFLN